MSPANKLRVCLLTETFYPVVGGGESQALALVEGLSAQGHTALVVTRRSDWRLPKREQLDRVAVHRLWPAGEQHLKKWGLLLSAAPALVRLRNDYDVLLVSGFRVLGLPAVLVSKLLRKRCILKADSLGEMSGEFFRGGLAQARLSTSTVPFRLFLSLRNAVLRRADAYVAISETVATELEAGGIDPEKVWRIPNSVDTARFRPVSPEEKLALRRKLGLPERACIVIYTGRLVSYKGLPLLLLVWKDVAAQHDNVYLLLVGPGSLDIHNCEAELRQYIQQEQLENSVRFTGAVRNVEAFLQAADIFAFPTNSEAFGISLVEAMACGLAVVSTAVGGLRDIVRDGQSALVVPPEDGDSLQEALDRLLADAALRQRLGIAARQTVEERYSTETVLQRYVQLIVQAANDRFRNGRKR
jgi:glycosyltransferase involved in cell wall biosynthesis